MKKLITLSVLVALVALSPAQALAVGTTSTSTKNIGERKAEQQQKSEERVQAQRETRQANVRAHLERMVKRFNAAVERLENLTARIESRIAKLKAENQNTSEAEANVATAKTKIALAKTEIAKFPALIDEILKQETLRGKFENLKSLNESIKTALKDAHAALVKAITSIKGLRTDKPSENNTNN